MRTKCSYFLATLLAVLFLACNKGEQDGITKNQFSYTGNDHLIASIIGQLKSTDFSSTVQTQFPDTKPDWEKNASYQRISDTTATVLVPLVHGSDTVKNYVKIDFDSKSERIAKISYYNYERDYLNNKSKYVKSLIGMDLKYLSANKSLLPSTFLVNEASAFYKKQAAKYFRKAAENTRRSNALMVKSGVSKVPATARSGDDRCEVSVEFSFYYSTLCNQYDIIDQFYTNLNIALTNKAQELGGTYNITYKSLPSVSISCSPIMSGFMEQIFVEAFNILHQQAGSCVINDYTFQMDASCMSDGGGGGTGGGEGEEEEDEEKLCMEFEKNQSAGVASVLQSAELDYDNGVSRSHIYKWVFYEQNWGMWRFISKEIGLHVLDNGVWKWAGMNHAEITLEGLVIGGSIECLHPVFNTTPGIYNYGVELSYTIKYSPISKYCEGLAFSIDQTSTIIFNVNDHN